MSSRKITVAFFVMAILTLLAACNAPPPGVAPTTVLATTAPTIAATLAPTTAPTTATVPTSTAVPATATASILTLTDSAGRKVTLSAVPQKIISLAPSTTEIAFALGAGDRVIAVDEFSDYPAAVKTLPKVTKGFDLNYEQLVALKPDLVLGAGITSKDVIKKLEDLKLNFVIVGSEKTTFATIKDDISLEAQALGAPDQAKQITSAMDSQLAELQAKVAKAKTTPRVYWELDATDPAKPYAPGPGNFIDDLIKLAGGTSVTASAQQPYAQFNAEEILKADPEIIILSDASYGIAPESVKARPGWDVISAVKNNKVFPIDDNLVSRPGPRIVLGLDAAAKLIHPEVFQ